MGGPEPCPLKFGPVPSVPFSSLHSMRQMAAPAGWLSLKAMSACVFSVDIIPTFVSEIGETLMNELQDDSEMFSYYGSLGSDQWSSSPSSSPGQLIHVLFAARPTHTHTHA